MIAQKIENIYAEWDGARDFSGVIFV